MTQEERLTGVYVALNVIFDRDIEELQKLVCEEFSLVARQEVHITLGFLGACSQAAIDSLAKALQSQVDTDPTNLTSLGIGGAFDDGRALRIVDNDTQQECVHYARVFWLALSLNDALYQLRSRLFNMAGRFGFEGIDIRKEYYPHITLGSGSPEDRLLNMWDTHKTPKVVSCPWDTQLPLIRCDKLHVTSTAIHPFSLRVLREIN